jgi:PAS domain S-box-containing protein
MTGSRSYRCKKEDVVTLRTFESDEAGQTLRAILDRIPEALLVHDADGRVLDVNAPLMAMYGVSREQAMSLSIEERFSAPENPTWQLRTLWQRVIKGEEFRFEWKAMRPNDGTSFAVEVYLSPLQLGGRSLISVLIRDISRQKEVESMLRHAQQQATNILESISDGFYALDRDWWFTYVNAEAERILERPRECLLGVGIWDEYPEAIGTPFEQNYRHAMCDRVTISFDVFYEPRKRWFSIAVYPAPDGGLSVFFRDVTDMKRLEENLRKFSRAVEQCPASVVITDLAGNIEYVNPKFTEVTGYSTADVLGRNPRMLKSGETPNDAYEQMWNTIRTGQWRGEFHNRKKNGELFWEAASIGPICDAAGVPTHYIAIKEEITERKRLEEALCRSEERFRIAAESADDLIFERDVLSGRFTFFGLEKLVRRQPTFAPQDLPGTIEEWKKMIHPDDYNRVLATISRQTEACKPISVEYRILTRTGEVRWWGERGQAVWDSGRKLVKHVGVINELPPRHISEPHSASNAVATPSRIETNT